MRFLVPAATARTARTVVALRAIVTVLVFLHVGLLLEPFSRAGLVEVALAAVGAIVLATAWSVHLLLTERPAPLHAAAWAIAALDAVALVTIARLTVEVDPTATIAWSFVLWVPFSIALRAAVIGSVLGSTLVALLVLGSSMLDAGVLTPLERTWTSVGVPMLLVLVAGMLSTLATLSQHRTRQRVRRQLDDERGIALRLREADDLKNTFLAAVSHELRTPLTSIMGFAITMLDRPELDDEQRHSMLRTIQTEAEHLEDILANLLDLDRLTRGKATLVPVDVDPASIVRGAVETVERRTGRGVDLDLQSGLRAELDAAKVERIVENLVSNACKYTPSDAEVRVELRAERGGILIRVDDSGPGIGRELRETIFEPFRRGVDVGVPGTGIGLSLVDRFSRMHGGRAWVEERPGGGCRFQVFLAVALAPAANPAVGEGARPAAAAGVSSPAWLTTTPPRESSHRPASGS